MLQINYLVGLLCGLDLKAEGGWRVEDLAPISVTLMGPVEIVYKKLIFLQELEKTF